MLVNERIARAEPLIVCGAPRCGTRFVTNALNTHPEILLNSEIPIQMMRPLLQYLDGSAKAYDALPQHRREWWGRNWRANHHAVLYVMWSTLNKRPGDRPERQVRWYGYKSPGHERYWREYQAFLAPKRPRFVFCIRNFEDHFLSAEAMHERGIEKRAAAYRESLDAWDEMSAALGDHASVFVLDDLAAGGIDYVRDVLFTRLRIPVDDSTLSRIDPATPVNTSEMKGHIKRSLTAEEQLFLQRSPDLTERFEALRLRWGHQARRP